MKNLTIYILLTIGLLTNCSAQESLLDLSVGQSSFKQTIKKAKQKNRPVLAILYTTQLPIDNTNSFKDLKGIVESANYEVVVIDWTKAPKRYPQKFIPEKGNPTWLAIHPDEVILSVGRAFKTNEDLSSFLTSARSIYDKIDPAYKKYKSSKKAEDLLALGEAAVASEDAPFITKTIEDYIKRVDTDNISNQTFKRILDLRAHARPAKRFYKLLSEQTDKAIKVSDLKTVRTYQQEYILTDLSGMELMEPYYVWERYEKELGYQADSMYRRFALIYFSSLQPDKKALYAEAYDYITLYPRSPWDLLDGLYEIVATGTDKKEELEEVLDLLFYQVSRDPGYRQLDLKALVLYKLGQKEKALNMVSQVNELALKKGVRYKSLIYSLSKK